MNRYLTMLFIFLQSICLADYHSQCGQDKFINETFFKNFKNGFFLEIGAFDGIHISNTYFFEKELDWSGICIEPIPEIFEKLEKNRNCFCICGCVSAEHDVWKDFLRISAPLAGLSGLVDKYDPEHIERIQRELKACECSSEIIKVRCYNLNRILEEIGINHVHFLSLDTEGGEFEILQNIDFSKYQIDVIAVEDNYLDFVHFSPTSR